MKLSASFDFENANRSASIDRSSDDEPTRGRRDQKPAIRVECHATASQIGHLFWSRIFPVPTSIRNTVPVP